MTTNEELERAVEHLAAVARSMSGDFTRITFPEEVAVKTADAIRTLLSERAELLDTVERMRGLLEEFVEPWAHLHDVEVYHACESQAKAFLITAARAALTTGEEK
jgi:hypothetical protein